MKVKLIPVTERKTKKGYIQDCLVKEDNLVIRIYTVQPYALGKEQEIDIKVDNSKLFFVKS